MRYILLNDLNVLGFCFMFHVQSIYLKISEDEEIVNHEGLFNNTRLYIICDLGNIAYHHHVLFVNY